VRHLPFWKFGGSGVVRVEDGLEEVGVARRTAHIFGRCAVSASEAQGAGRQDGIRRVALLHRHPVFPVIAEVVEVLERLHARECGLALDALLGTGRVAPVELRVGDAVALADDLEFVQMPADDALDDVMKPAESDRLGDDDPAPDMQPRSPPSTRGSAEHRRRAEPLVLPSQFPWCPPSKMVDTFATQRNGIKTGQGRNLRENR